MLYILIGLPYSGKTTLTRELVRRFGFSSVSMDDIIDERGYEVEQMTQDDWDSVYYEGYMRLKALLVQGQTVVLDLANLRRSERTLAKEIAASVGSPYKLIYLDIPPSKIRERWLENAETKARGQLEEVTLQRALGMFEEPTAGEHYLTYDSTTDLGRWIDANIAQAAGTVTGWRVGGARPSHQQGARNDQASCLRASSGSLVHPLHGRG